MGNVTLPAGASAIVTGGGSGIGRAIAAKLVAAGANVVLASRRGDLVAGVARELSAGGPGRAVGVACDLRKRGDADAVVARATAEFARVDVLVNNSGIGGPSRVAECTDEEWDRILETNLRGAFWMMRGVLPGMIAQRAGYIINIASQAGKHGYANAGPYCASKFGLIGLTEALQAEVREQGIIVHALCPAIVQVPPPGSGADLREGVLQVEDLASTVMFLLSQPRRVKFENIGLYHL
jgi:NAD(P)-dependent dehydrogenase (short-subunit alcohol dehydrogenase family)